MASDPGKKASPQGLPRQGAGGQKGSSKDWGTRILTQGGEAPLTINP